VQDIALRQEHQIYGLVFHSMWSMWITFE